MKASATDGLHVMSHSHHRSNSQHLLTTSSVLFKELVDVFSCKSLVTLVKDANASVESSLISEQRGVRHYWDSFHLVTGLPFLVERWFLINEGMIYNICAKA